MKIVILSLVLVFSGRIPVAGTTVILNRTPVNIVVAADSLWSHADGNGEFPPVFGCKIVNVGHMYFAASTADIDAVFLESLAREAMRTSVTVGEAAHKLTLQRGVLARHTAKYFSQDVIDRVWKNGRGSADIILFGMERGQPRFILINFLEANRSRAKLKFRTEEHVCPVECVSNHPVVLGIHENIDKAVKSDPRIVARLGPQAALRELVRIEEDTSDLVGGAIDVLTVDAKGAHWESSTGGMCSPDEDH